MQAYNEGEAANNGNIKYPGIDSKFTNWEVIAHSITSESLSLQLMQIRNYTKETIGIAHLQAISGHVQLRRLVLCSHHARQRCKITHLRQPGGQAEDTVRQEAGPILDCHRQDRLFVSGKHRLSQNAGRKRLQVRIFRNRRRPYLEKLAHLPVGIRTQVVQISSI